MPASNEIWWNWGTKIVTAPASVQQSANVIQQLEVPMSDGHQLCKVANVMLTMSLSVLIWLEYNFTFYYSKLQSVYCRLFWSVYQTQSLSWERVKSYKKWFYFGVCQNGVVWKQSSTTQQGMVYDNCCLSQVQFIQVIDRSLTHLDIYVSLISESIYNSVNINYLPVCNASEKKSPVSDSEQGVLTYCLSLLCQ